MMAMTIHYTEWDSPVGRLLIAATDKGIRGLYFEQHKYFKGAQDWLRQDNQPHLNKARTQLGEYFSGTRVEFDLPLDMPGTTFQQAVWKELLSLPFGFTTSYQAIAQRLGNPLAIRAVGTAIGRNPVSIVVPCHRVLSASGALSGYAGGLERKSYLLQLERQEYEQLGICRSPFRLNVAQS